MNVVGRGSYRLSLDQDTQQDGDTGAGISGQSKFSGENATQEWEEGALQKTSELSHSFQSYGEGKSNNTTSNFSLGGPSNKVVPFGRRDTE